MKRTASAAKNSRSSVSSTKTPVAGRPQRASRSKHVVCIKSGGYVDLEPLKIYRTKADRKSESLGFVRVVDSSGEDYLFPADFFRPIEVPARLFALVEKHA